MTPKYPLSERLDAANLADRFRDPGGSSALHPGKRLYPCPTCDTENALTYRDKKKGYQCDVCASRAEGDLSNEY